MEIKNLKYFLAVARENLGILLTFKDLIPCSTSFDITLILSVLHTCSPQLNSGIIHRVTSISK